MEIFLKSPEQIDGIRQSCRVAVNVLKRIKDYILPGMQTIELNDIIDSLIRRQNAIPATLNYKGFPSSSCISVNNGICHGVPNKKILDLGDVVKIDVTTIFNGYFGDTCYTWVVGNKWSAEATRIISVARKCLWAGIESVRPGRRFGAISAAVSAVAEKYGCAVVKKFCRHGVGLEFHEPPYVQFDRKDGDFGEIIRPGMTFTVEPMISEESPNVIIDASDGWSAYTADGKLSAQFEHTVLVTPNGYEVLTDWGDEKEMMQEWKLPEELCLSH